MKETKPFYRTSEFWAVIALSAANLLGVFNVPGKWQGIFQIAITGLYAVARGLSKSGVPYAPEPHPTKDLSDPQLDDPSFDAPWEVTP